MNASHPLVALGGFILGVLFVWVRRRPFRLDITIRRDEDEERVRE